MARGEIAASVPFQFVRQLRLLAEIDGTDAPRQPRDRSAPERRIPTEPLTKRRKISSVNQCSFRQTAVQPALNPQEVFLWSE
jgi:hypothetical protein